MTKTCTMTAGRGARPAGLRWLAVLCVVGLLPAAAFAQPAPAPEPAAVVKAFYAWHQANPETYFQRFASQREAFTPELFGLLTKAFRPGSPEYAPDMDFDPFVFAQLVAERVTVGTETVQGDSASVPVTIRFSKDNTKSLMVRLVRQGGSWKIANLTDGKEIDLLAYLKRLPAKVS